MTDIDNLRILLRLKTIDRQIPSREGLESTAEHTWGCMILADYFLKIISQNLNRERVMDLLMYHDVAGDVDFLDEEGRKGKENREKDGFQKLVKQIPLELRDKFAQLFEEYNGEITLEAQFAKAIDKIEPAIHVLDYKQRFRARSLTEKRIRERKDKYFEPFPEIKKVHEEILQHFKENGYLAD